MNDICKCVNDKCPIKEHCYRWTVKSDYRQTVSHFNKELKEECEYYWKTSDMVYNKK